MTALAIFRHLGFAALLMLLSAATVRTMIAVRVMDTPEARKMHDRPTPKGGGVGIVVTFLAGIAVLYRYAEFSRLADPYFLGVIEASVAIAVVAFLDDLFDWPFVVKLGAQVLAALVAVGSGLYVTDFRIPYLGPLPFVWAGVGATVVWMLFTTNAMNFIDGLNGLASGVSLIACLFIVFIAEQHGGWFAYAAAGLLASGLAGFLPFNFPKARIFMGDVGSQFCGFMLAVLAVVASRFDGVELSFLLMPMLLSGVLFDVGFTLVRRLLAGEAVTQPHRGHLYQVAQRSGVPAVTVTLVHWGFAIFGGGCCLLFIALPSPLKPPVPFITLAPQLVWVWFVARRARAARLGRWG
ncbi:MAG TPA: UDP-phosphate N-acetylglucosaminyl-1-phosphate transferase [Acetobacteraceae bacterium]|jgi:UDP-GlcNAc:undecaprenyl-phosphate/decaprenyl-phosphate GlcNAc-1-phosphate transferase|nr:UDP-phosphate N-acetylglucosaminyl-1-phosphate transferase [Acetobacteraceae bacterium]